MKRQIGRNREINKETKRDTHGETERYKGDRERV